MVLYFTHFALMVLYFTYLTLMVLFLNDLALMVSYFTHVLYICDKSCLAGKIIILINMFWLLLLWCQNIMISNDLAHLQMFGWFCTTLHNSIWFYITWPTGVNIFWFDVHAFRTMSLNFKLVICEVFLNFWCTCKFLLCNPFGDGDITKQGCHGGAEGREFLAVYFD